MAPPITSCLSEVADNPLGGQLERDVRSPHTVDIGGPDCREAQSSVAAVLGRCGSDPSCRYEDLGLVTSVRLGSNNCADPGVFLACQAASATLVHVDSKETVRRFIEEVWVGGRAERIETYVAEDYVSVGLRTGTGGYGHAAVVENVTQTRQRYPHRYVVVHELLSEGELVACHPTLMSPRDDNREHEIRKNEIVILRRRDDKLVQCVSVGTDWA